MRRVLVEDERIFGPTVHRLELAAGVRLGLLARPRIVVVDVADPTVQGLATAGGLDLNRARADGHWRRSRSTGPRAWPPCRPPCCESPPTRR
ncbi:hypothetical protein [Embleya sp. NBC_00896]|uniref:hypothetical protein n=1 Tax=Embleya sp. NBC_00896 TaxID=2975961 RepID=UPI002F91585E|nr:hypothetical protein OG928_45185 [Embleya sp. NBC_00896]